MSDYNSLIHTITKSHINLEGGLAQLARAPALHAGGQRFESVILHSTLRFLKGIGYNASYRKIRGNVL